MTELKFPITFDKCPNCGSNKRIAEIVTNEEIEKGRIEPGNKTAFMIAKTVITDPKTLKFIISSKEVVVLLGAFDACADCGTLYCISASKGTGTVGTQAMTPTGKMPPGFGRG